ncbi:iron ABC transporter permease [Komagataeibacter intermedius]|uniref:ABC transporter permease n=2 Tax=Komagataeibacter intermedius TaxID=66229 RepID=A0A0N1F8Q8_9PROT|nr:iron ABC transporter permease [Komagataeibacter intermedius]KPH86772.1 ABC transporter permease [Komagataeibacter intermedius AF2]MCF3637019.1 iron ABC transporter permease [Komagataeibacter intermedius]GAN86648.1 ABC transporter ferrichrome Fe3+-siderophore transporter [Komagataeibacter intermedius TF2]GBQ67222.1 ferrichrome ABC transporter permease [Komagataeibacter intermedius NRIC 0521]
MKPDRNTLLLNIVLLAGVVVLSGMSLVWGETRIMVWQALGDILAGRHGAGAIIVEQLRLPRALLAIMVGGTLGLSGAVLQGYLRNPLADPGILGVSGGAALGAVSVFYTGLMQVSVMALPLGGLAGALCAVVVLMGLVGRGGTLVLLLAGAALSSFAAALTALVLNLVPSPYASFEIMHWLMGSLTDRTFTHVWICLPGVVCGMLLMLSAGRALDALTLGEDVAESLGFRLHGVCGMQTRIVLGAALSVGSCVAVSGAIGFVGLVVPHLLRPLTGYQPSRLLVPSALGGSLLLLGADMVVRVVSAGTELQLGVLTALVGAPVFFIRVIMLKRTGS